MAFIYILHFDHPNHHAEHYTGATTSLKQRLIAHATGGGSLMCRRFHEKGIPWRLGGLFDCNQTAMRSIERKLKDSNNVPRYCGLCNATPEAPPGSRAYPIDGIPFPTASELIRPVTTWQQIRVDLASNNRVNAINFCVDLMKKETETLGFIPTPALAKFTDDGLVAIVYNNNQPVGYCVFTIAASQQTITIAQCVVSDDARLMQHGLSLIMYVRAMRPNAWTKCKVRDDLPANAFWQRVGFERKRQVAHKTSGHKLNHYFAKPILTIFEKE